MGFMDDILSGKVTGDQTARDEQTGAYLSPHVDTMSGDPLEDNIGPLFQALGIGSQQPKGIQAAPTRHIPISTGPSDEEIRRSLAEADRMHNIVDFPSPPSEEELARGPQLPNALGDAPSTIENAKAMILAEAEEPGIDTEQLRPYTEDNAFAFPTGPDQGFDTQGYDPVTAASRGQAGNAFLNRNRTGSPIQSPPGREGGILQAIIQAIMSSGGGDNAFLRRNQR